MAFEKHARGRVTEVGTVHKGAEGKVVLSSVKKIGEEDEDKRKDITVGRRKKKT